MDYLQQLLGLSEEEKNQYLEIMALGKSSSFPTLNYIVSCMVMKSNVLDMGFVDFQWLTKEEAHPKKFLIKNLQLIKMQFGLSIPKEYFYTPTYVREVGEHKIVVWELPDVKSECDCNYIACVELRDKKLYVTSEYYSFGDIFKLCSFNKEGHSAYSHQVDSLESFIEGIVKTFK
ncbi:MAG: hypothetical protein J6R44_04460 [Clostridia bacterium]|nr:hypothetical protein [Clostridia bacterium]